MAAPPPPPPPIQQAGGKVATPPPTSSAQATPHVTPTSPAATPPSRVLASDGALTPAVVYACWLRMFPGCPRTVSRKEGEAFVRAIGLPQRFVNINCETFRIVDVLLALRDSLPAGEVMPMPLTTAEEAEPFLCPPPLPDHAAEYLKSAQAHKGSYIALLPKDIRLQVISCAACRPPAALSRREYKDLQPNILGSEQPVIGQRVAFVPSLSTVGDCMVRAISLQTGEVVWESFELHASLPSQSHRCATSDGALVFVLGREVLVHKPPNRRHLQDAHHLLSDCLNLVAHDRDAYILCGRLPYTLNRLGPQTHTDGWPRYSLTELARWNAEPSSAALGGQIDHLCVARTVHGVVCAALTPGVILLYNTRTNKAEQVSFEQGSHSNHTIALSYAALFHLSFARLITLALDDLKGRPVVTKLSLPSMNVILSSLLCLPDGTVAAVITGDKGLLVARMDATGRNLLHSAFTKCAPYFGHRTVQAYGNEFVACPTMGATRSSTGILFVSLRDSSTLNVKDDRNSFLSLLAVRNGALVCRDDQHRLLVLTPLE